MLIVRLVKLDKFHTVSAYHTLTKEDYMHINKTLNILPIFCFLTTGTSCHKDTVTLKFIQHVTVDYYIDETGERNGYIFKPEVVSTAEFQYEYGHYITKEEINEYYSDKIKYIMTTDSCYFSITFFMTDFDEKTGIATNMFKPQVLKKDVTIHYGLFP